MIFSKFVQNWWFFKFWQKLDDFLKFRPKMVIFQILSKKQIFAKNDDFSNFGQNWWFFQISSKNDDFSKFGKNWWFFKFGQKWWFLKKRTGDGHQSIVIITQPLTESWSNASVVSVLNTATPVSWVSVSWVLATLSQHWTL